MFAQVHTPIILRPDQLDDYLENGWFRMGQNIFTTNFLNFKGQFYSALWLRINLAGYSTDKTEQKLRKANARFKVQIGKAAITPLKEELFSRYRESITFEASGSLQQLLFGKASYDVYNTFEVTVYEEEKLIACGFFDLGARSAAGITSFYDPAFKKHTLGKYLIYLKINFCREIGLDFFYPGYFVPGYSFFDYKLSIGRSALEYLDFTHDSWSGINNFSPLLTPIRIMRDKLYSLQIILAQSKIESQILRYEFFEANLLPELKDVELFDYPVFLYYPGLSRGVGVVVTVYDFRDKVYRIVRCRSLWNSNLPNSDEMYSSELLKEEQVIFSSRYPDEIVTALADESRNPIDIT